MKIAIVLAVPCAVWILGCAGDNRAQELEKQLSQNRVDSTAFEQRIAERDKYLEEVIHEVNNIFGDLEQARMKEGSLSRRAKSVEGVAGVQNLDTKQQLLANIKEIGTSLTDNRKRIGQLQSRIKSMQGEFASLNKLVENLKTTLQEREASIAELQGRVQGLETAMRDKTAEIQRKDDMLDRQQGRINMVYYVAGTRDELEKKGIITSEGGFLWGLLGSTTVMASGVDTTEFTPLDRTKFTTFHIEGKVDEILPHRSTDFFASAEVNDSNTDLTILKPDKFWQEHYLVVVLD